VSSHPNQTAVTLIEEAEDALRQLKALFSTSSTAQEPQEFPSQMVLAEILQKGASVTKGELYALAERHGMDRRGLGGLFRQSGKTSLYELAGTDKVVLTPYGAEMARRVLERRPTIMYEEPTVAYSKVAEESFAEDWGSEEDSVYDEL
jgi:hypothetical protein